MFEYVNPKKEHDKDEIKVRVLTVLLTLAGAAGVFAVLYWAASGA